MDKWILLSFAVAQLCQVATLLVLSARNGDVLSWIRQCKPTFDLSATGVQRGSTVILTPPIELSDNQARAVAGFMRIETERTGVEFVVMPGPGWSAKVSSGAPE